jgi:hypothetical protein
MEVSWLDVAHTLNAQHAVGVQFEACPVGGHNFHGMVERGIREVKKLFNTVYSGVKLDVLGFQTAFSWISNELNNLPLCLGSRYRDLDHLDLLTPNRLIHGRANRRALSGCCMVDKPSLMLARMEEVFEAWWRAWHDEKLADFIGKPAKWFRSAPSLQVGDIVLFQKSGEEQVLGEPVWRVGRIVEVEESERDSAVRAVVIEYKNATENVFRTTRRAARTVAVLHKEDELELVQHLNQAAREGRRLARQAELYVDQQSAVVREVEKCLQCAAPFMCSRHYTFFCLHPFMQTQEIHAPQVDENEVCHSQLCAAFSIHQHY